MPLLELSDADLSGDSLEATERFKGISSAYYIKVIEPKGVTLAIQCTLMFLPSLFLLVLIAFRTKSCWFCTTYKSFFLKFYF